MIKLAKRVSILTLIIMLASLSLPWTMQNGTVPSEESSLFYSHVQAAPSWLPWFGEEATALDFSGFGLYALLAKTLIIKTALSLPLAFTSSSVYIVFTGLLLGVAAGSIPAAFASREDVVQYL